MQVIGGTVFPETCPDGQWFKFSLDHGRLKSRGAEMKSKPLVDETDCLAGVRCEVPGYNPTITKIVLQISHEILLSCGSVDD